jgi:hypothetical protein
MREGNLMLLIVSFFGVVQLAAAYGCYALARRSHRGLGVASLLGGIGFFLVLPTLNSPFLFLQFLTLLAIGLTCRFALAREKSFLLSGSVASVVALGVLGVLWQNRWAPLRERYPIESLATRLAYEKRHAETHAEATIDAGLAIPSQALVALDEFYERSSASWGARRRTQALQLVHASQVAQFIESEGFGVGRGMRPAISTIELPRDRPLIEMPAGEQTLTASDGTPESAASLPMPLAEIPDQPRLRELHVGALMNFVDPRGFGYVSDREHVVGFESHRFNELPETYNQRWRTYRVELVSLLKHDRPMVYVSKHLPAMSELQNAPVRPLDEFEERGLAILRSGHEIETESTLQGIRMIGAIRAAKQCMVCHTVDHGALLGAFSYEFRPVSPEKAPVEPLPKKPAMSAADQQATSSRKNASRETNPDGTRF